MDLVRFFTGKKKNKPGICVKDGKIFSTAQNVTTRTDLQYGPMIYTLDGINHLPAAIKNFGPVDLCNITQKVIQMTDSPEPCYTPVEKLNLSQSVGCLSLPCKYHASYLTDVNDSGDLGLFLDYLAHLGRSEHTQREYFVDLRIWKRELDGEINLGKVQSVLSNQTPHRARRMLFSLKAYGRYRNFHGDPRIVIFLATSELKMPALPKSRREKLTPETVKIYRKSARDMTQKGNKVGIWIGLTLLGVKASEIATVTFNGNGKVSYVRNGKVFEKKCPQWLYNALHEIERSKWALGKRSVWKGLKSYGVTPYTLYYSRHLDSSWLN